MVMYDPASRGIEMVPAQSLVGLPGEIGVDRESVHLCNIYSLEEELYDVLQKLEADYNKIIPEVIEYDAKFCDDAEIIIISHGVVSRAAWDAVKMLRDQGVRAGYFRPITLRPFPQEALKKAAASARKILVVESAVNQLQRLVKENLYGLTLGIESLAKPGVGIDADEIVARYKEIQG